MSRLPDRVRVVEVGSLDALQNVPVVLTSEDKISLIARLSSAGLPTIEVTSFVSPRWIPQLADAEVAVVNVHGLSGNPLDEVPGYRVIDLDGPVRRLELIQGDEAGP